MRDSEALEQVRAVAPTRKPHVAGDAQMREQPVVLRQISDATPLRAEVDPGFGVEPDLVAERDPASVRVLEPGDAPQQRGLARAGGPDERDRLGAERQLGAKIERSPREGDIREEVHEPTSSLTASRIAALTMISSTPIAIA